MDLAPVDSDHHYTVERIVLAYLMMIPGLTLMTLLVYFRVPDFQQLFYLFFLSAWAFGVPKLFGPGKLNFNLLGWLYRMIIFQLQGTFLVFTVLLLVVLAMLPAFLAAALWELVTPISQTNWFCLSLISFVAVSFPLMRRLWPMLGGPFTVTHIQDWTSSIPVVVVYQVYKMTEGTHDKIPAWPTLLPFYLIVGTLMLSMQLQYGTPAYMLLGLVGIWLLLPLQSFVGIVYSTRLNLVLEEKYREEWQHYQLASQQKASKNLWPSYQGKTITIIEKVPQKLPVIEKDFVVSEPPRPSHTPDNVDQTTFKLFYPDDFDPPLHPFSPGGTGEAFGTIRDVEMSYMFLKSHWEKDVTRFFYTAYAHFPGSRGLLYVYEKIAHVFYHQLDEWTEERVRSLNQLYPPAQEGDPKRYAIVPLPRFQYENAESRDLMNQPFNENSLYDTFQAGKKRCQLTGVPIVIALCLDNIPLDS